ncbi:MAG: hypothetical protein ACT4OE_05440 [Sphingosinicella sp.]
MNFARIGLVLLAFVAGAAPAATRNQIGEREAFTIEPNKAYIFFRSERRLPYQLLREVTPAQRAAHESERNAAFVRARRSYERNLALWQERQRGCAGSQAGQCSAPRPTPVTEATFTYPPPEMDNFVAISDRPRLTAEENGWSGYLVAVDPGTYILYGQLMAVPNAASFGTCVCMGAVKFEARGGGVTYVGEVGMAPEEIIGRPDLENFRVGPLMTVTPFAPSMPMPPQLAGRPVVPAQLHAADRMPNFFGVLISRLAPVPGVLAYERDRVIDLAGQGETASGN